MFSSFPFVVVELNKKRTIYKFYSANIIPRS